LRTLGETLTDVFTYTIEDGSSAPSTAQITITIQGANDNPNDITTTGLTILENAANGTSAGIVNGLDSDATDMLAYELVDDAGGRFAVDPFSGEVSVANSSLLDYEVNTTHSVTVKVTDLAGLTFQNVLAIAVVDLNEFSVTIPIDTDGSANIIAEDAPIGTAVGITIFAFDADATTSAVTYSLDDDAHGLFRIDSNSGVVTVNSALDFEAATSHTIVVRATSLDTSAATQSFTILVTDVNEFSITTISDTNAAADTVLENSQNGTTVGIVAFAADGDGTATVSYSLDDTAGGRFAIDAFTGLVTVNGSLDYETAHAYVIIVRATSQDTSFATQAFTISLLNTNETPVISPWTIVTDYITPITFNAPGAFNYVDDPELDPLTISLVGQPSSGTVNLQSNGTLTYSPINLFEGTTSFELEFSDGSLSSQLVVQVVVNRPINLPPPTGGGSGGGVGESSGSDTGSGSNEASAPTFVAPSPVSDASLEAIQVLLGNSQTQAIRSDDVSPQKAAALATADVALGSVFYVQNLALAWQVTDSSSIDSFRESYSGHRGPVITNDLRFVGPNFKRMIESNSELQDRDWLSRVAPTVTTAIGTGAVIWLVQAGHVVTSLVGRGATWISIDPLVVIEGARGREAEEDEGHSIGELFDHGK
ncbi:MAG: cadherin domain-containing protein, partial [Planctomycetales bacterium]|nr:cadherin domain-containing protein [Planctomycetales bacterium]